MNHTDIAAKTAAYLETFVGKEGFKLLKTEYVLEDGIRYLRAYIDLTDEEREAREQKMKSETSEEAVQEAEREGALDECETEAAPQEPGIGINDCAIVSRRLSKWLDKEDFIPEEYMLEVCSKGYLN